MDPEGGSSKGNKNIQPSDTMKNKNPGDPSSSSSPKENMEDELQDFRDKWQKELLISPKLSKNSECYVNDITGDDPDKTSDEERAKTFYLMAVEMEKTGKMFEAVKFYKKAFDLVFDIDHRLFESMKMLNNNSEDKKAKTGNKKMTAMYAEGDVLHKLQNKTSGPICFPKHEQNSTHISSLPIELILYILKWVVSQDLDMRSLEMFGQVCQGFYICARDTEIWKLACIKVWGPNCKLDKYISWRHMFLERPRLLFNGCYISKTTYIRHGENSFQDQFYRPWHLITYYRYFRFFPDGTVLMLTTPDEPNMSVSQLKSRTPRSPVLSGYYRLKDDRVVITVYRQENKNNQNIKRNTRRDLHPVSDQTFDMELMILNHKSRKHIQLQWTHYSIRTRNRGEENICVFDLVGSKFPPLWFSRVKSYAVESEGPLN